MRSFHRVLGVTLLAVTLTYFVWFALTFWAYLSTKSVISTSIIAGLQLVAGALSAVWFGSIVDHHKKKDAMVWASVATLVLFSAGLAFFVSQPAGAFSSVLGAPFLVFALILLAGSVMGSMYSIAVPTLIGVLVPESERDKANGLFGTVVGVSFALTSVASGLVLAFGGMFWVLVVAIVGTLVVIALWLFIHVPEPAIDKEVHLAEKSDFKKTLETIHSIPGLFPLILFTTFNNFLGGVFMALMDAYGLNLVSVETWGFLLGVLSLAFIVGGVYISKKGLGTNPLRTLFVANLISWGTCIFFTMQPSVVLLALGMLVWMTLFPFVQATEQTIFQKVVPPERLGRVFGFARGLEQAAAPITAFLIGPIAEWLFIPFMTTGAGVDWIGPWFGVGTGRGIAIVFILAGVIGFLVTVLAMRSKPYRELKVAYERPSVEPAITSRA